MRNPKQYWNKCADDKDVDIKYICDLPTELCLKDFKRHGKTLEIGCGVGRLMQDGDYGIDISDKMLAIAKKRKPKCHFKITTGDIPYPDRYFNTVYSYLLFQHLKMPEITKYLKEAYRVITDNGNIVFQYIEGDDNSDYSNHYDSTVMIEQLKRAGFKNIHQKSSIVHPQWSIMGATK